MTHDIRRLEPYPPSIARAAGPWKWTVDGYRLVDFWMGHGSLLLGHGHPAVVAAIADQIAALTHAGGSHEAEIAWAEQVCALIPSAERVRFTNSGTEAVMLATRVARAVTARTRVLMLDGHFHGWHDEALSPYVDGLLAGVPEHVAEGVVLGSPLDTALLKARIAERDLAAVILEPGGGGAGALPRDVGLLRMLHEVTHDAGTLLIFDETITGFRAAPGGVQAVTGIHPDITVLGKILSGGLPGGAIVGTAPVMAVFERTPGRSPRVRHAGTHNASPLAAAAGRATLARIADGVAQATATAAADALVLGVNAAAESHDADVRLYTDGSSVFHVQIGAIGARAALGPSPDTFALYAARPARYASLRRALLLEGVDTHSLHGWVSAAHDDRAIATAIVAFDRAFSRLVDAPSAEDDIRVRRPGVD